MTQLCFAPTDSDAGASQLPREGSKKISKLRLDQAAELRTRERRILTRCEFTLREQQRSLRSQGRSGRS